MKALTKKEKRVKKTQVKREKESVVLYSCPFQKIIVQLYISERGRQNEREEKGEKTFKEDAVPLRKKKDRRGYQNIDLSPTVG